MSATVNRSRAAPVPIVTVRCVGCGAKKDVRADSVAPGDVPMCDLCYMPMATISAKVKR